MWEHFLPVQGCSVLGPLLVDVDFSRLHKVPHALNVPCNPFIVCRQAMDCVRGPRYSSNSGRAVPAFWGWRKARSRCRKSGRMQGALLKRVLAPRQHDSTAVSVQHGIRSRLPTSAGCHYSSRWQITKATARTQFGVAQFCRWAQSPAISSNPL